MTEALAPCPHLPPPVEGMDWRGLAQHEENRDGAFYLSALEYAQTLWVRRIPARAILCLDRAMGAAVAADEPVLDKYPMPYAAMAWFLTHAPADVFVGNPRVHFQHYADRLREPRRAIRSARAWACWALARVCRPEWPGDPRHEVREPTFEEIEQGLQREGLPGEVAIWKRLIAEYQDK